MWRQRSWYMAMEMCIYFLIMHYIINVSLDTHFYENVNLIYQDHDIKSDDLFLKYSDKEVKISNNVYYKGLKIVN